MKKALYTLALIMVLFAAVVNRPKGHIPIQASDGITSMLSDASKSFVRIEKSAVMFGGVRQPTSYGSGVIIGKTKKGNVVLTNNHVCKRNEVIAALWGPEALAVRDLNGSLIPAYVIKSEASQDVCILFISGTSMPSIKIAKRGLRVGDIAYNISAPKGIYFPEQGVAPISIGIFSGNVEGGDLYSLNIRPGSSGSMILNERGELVGLIKAYFPAAPYLCLGVPLQFIHEFLSPK